MGPTFELDATRSNVMMRMRRRRDDDENEAAEATAVAGLAQVHLLFKGERERDKQSP